MQAAVFKQLAHVLQRVHGVLHGLGREAVHQVGVDEDTGVGKGLGDAGDLLDADAFFISFNQAVRGHLQPAGMAMQPLAQRSSAASSGVKVFQSGRCPTTDGDAPAQQLLARPGRFGRCGFVSEVEAGLAGLRHDGLDAVHQRGGGRGLVA